MSVPDLRWQDQAACRGADPALFSTPEVERPGARRVREAKARAICAGCPVWRPCLEFALDQPQQYGFWAGMTEEGRRYERRRRRRRATEAARRAA